MPPRSFWDDLQRLADNVPASAWAKVPRDAARNLDHYLDGTPRQR
jgi:hypothetical protein